MLKEVLLRQWQLKPIVVIPLSIKNLHAVNYMGFCAHFSDKSNVTASPLIRKGVKVNQLQQNNQLIPMNLRIKVNIATDI